MISKYKVFLLIITIAILLTSFLGCAPDEPKLTYKEAETTIRSCASDIEQYLHEAQWDRGELLDVQSPLFLHPKAVDPWVVVYEGDGKLRAKGIVVEMDDETEQRVVETYATTWTFKEFPGKEYPKDIGYIRLIEFKRLVGGILEPD